MSNAQSIRLAAIPVQTVAYSAVTSSFVAMGAAMPEPIRVIKINNSTNSDIYVSFDGSTAHDVVVASSGMVVDITTNKSIEQGMFLSQGTVVYIEYVSGAPTSGNVYLSAYYAANS